MISSVCKLLGITIIFICIYLIECAALARNALCALLFIIKRLIIEHSCYARMRVANLFIDTSSHSCLLWQFMLSGFLLYLFFYLIFHWCCNHCTVPSIWYLTVFAILPLLGISPLILEVGVSCFIHVVL